MMKISGTVILVVSCIFMSITRPAMAAKTDFDNHHTAYYTVMSNYFSQIEQIKSWQSIGTGRFRIKGTPEGSNFPGLMYPLAVAWKENTETGVNDNSLLNRIELAVKAVVKDIDNDGRIDLVGVDGTVWNKFHDPWVYMNMIRTYEIVKGSLKNDVETHWKEKLHAGFKKIAERELINAPLHNLPLVQAVALHIAAVNFHESTWEQIARNYIRKVLEAQEDDGYWSEHQGPLVEYNLIYMYALGIYYAVTGDEKTKMALEKGAAFHYRMRYLDGSSIETVDERNYYSKEIRAGNIGFAFSHEGIKFITEQYAVTKYLWYYFTADLLNYQDRIDKQILSEKSNRQPVSFISDKGRIAVRHDGNWQRVVSAHVAKQSPSRWIQDRQNFLSIFHRDVGLIVGGGNTKLQPRWSTFAVGATNLMEGRGGENPDFITPVGLIFIPDSAEVLSSGDFGVRLKYGLEEAMVRTRIRDDRSLAVEYTRVKENATPMMAHMTIIPHAGTSIKPGKGRKAILGSEPFVWSAGSFGGQFEHNGVRYTVSSDATVRWPVYPYDPYRKDGRTELKNARVVVELPFSKTVRRQLVQIDVLPVEKR